MGMNGSFCLYQDVYDLTISVSVAECVVFVLLFDFHLHCLAPALECKQDPLPGSVKGEGGSYNQPDSIWYMQKYIHLTFN